MSKIHYQIFAVGIKKMPEIKITNTKQKRADEELVRKTNEELILQYLRKIYPWIKTERGYYYRNKWWGDYCGRVCLIYPYDTYVDVTVYVDCLGTEEFGSFLSTIYPDRRIDIDIREYKERPEGSCFGQYL